MVPMEFLVGTALQRDRYRARDWPVFDYTYTVPGVFAQDDYSPLSWLIMSATELGKLEPECATSMLV